MRAAKSTRRAARVAPLLVALAGLAASGVAGVLIVVVGVAPARGANTSTPAPCWRQLLNEWYSGAITTIYPTHCYDQAISHLPRDIAAYSSAKQNIQAAEAAAAHGKLPSLIRRNSAPTGSLLPCFVAQPGRPCTEGVVPKPGIVLKRVGGVQSLPSWFWPVLAGCLVSAAVGIAYWRRPPRLRT